MRTGGLFKIPKILCDSFYIELTGPGIARLYYARKTSIDKNRYGWSVGFSDY